MAGNWEDATRPPMTRPVPLEDIELIRLIAFELYDATGRVPTAEQIQAAMQRPGA